MIAFCLLKLACELNSNYSKIHLLNSRLTDRMNCWNAGTNYYFYLLTFWTRNIWWVSPWTSDNEFARIFITFVDILTKWKLPIETFYWNNNQRKLHILIRIFRLRSSGSRMRKTLFKIRESPFYRGGPWISSFSRVIR